MVHSSYTVESITQQLKAATEHDFKTLERSLLADTRKGVQDALNATRKRLAMEKAERDRLRKLYAYQEELAVGKVLVGLDEVGRGPLAGPLTVAAVVLPQSPHIEGLNDSKQVPEERREDLASEIKDKALAWSISHIEPHAIDAAGMAACLCVAFLRALSEIDEKIKVEVVLLDGSPMKLDKREINVIKGDSKCASIAAASLIAKVERDALMCDYALKYPQYGFERCKGYASPDHIKAIETHGLTPLHRKSFCTSFMQESLF